MPYIIPSLFLSFIISQGPKYIILLKEFFSLRNVTCKSLLGRVKMVDCVSCIFPIPFVKDQALYLQDPYDYRRAAGAGLAICNSHSPCHCFITVNTNYVNFSNPLLMFTKKAVKRLLRYIISNIYCHMVYNSLLVTVGSIMLILVGCVFDFSRTHN